MCTSKLQLLTLTLTHNHKVMVQHGHLLEKVI